VAETPRWRRWGIEIAWLLAIAVVYFGARIWQQRTLVEGPAPALHATLLDGTAFELGEKRDRPVLVYFWATWCTVCRLEQGNIESLLATHSVVGVALQSGNPADVKQYLDTHQLQVPVINDPEGSIAAAWGVRATPTSFIVDRDGQIRFREVGYTTEAGLRLRLWWASL